MCWVFYICLTTPSLDAIGSLFSTRVIEVVIRLTRPYVYVALVIITMQIIMFHAQSSFICLHNMDLAEILDRYQNVCVLILH